MLAKVLSLIILLAAGVTAEAATRTADLTTPIHAFIDAFNKGDGKTAAATHSANVTIIDEVPPYVWRGATAFADWSRDLTANEARQGITEENVALGEVVRTESTGDHAYVVMAATYGFKDHGAPMHEPARMTFVLHKAADGWKITAWTWTGPKPLKGAVKP